MGEIDDTLTTIVGSLLALFVAFVIFVIIVSVILANTTNTTNNNNSKLTKQQKQITALENASPVMYHQVTGVADNVGAGLSSRVVLNGFGNKYPNILIPFGTQTLYRMIVLVETSSWSAGNLYVEFRSDVNQDTTVKSITLTPSQQTLIDPPIDPLFNTSSYISLALDEPIPPRPLSVWLRGDAAFNGDPIMEFNIHMYFKSVN